MKGWISVGRQMDTISTTISQNDTRGEVAYDEQSYLLLLEIRNDLDETDLSVFPLETILTNGTGSNLVKMVNFVAPIPGSDTFDVFLERT